MSGYYDNESRNQLFRFRLPSLRLTSGMRTVGIYLSGALFAAGLWSFVDAAVYSKVANAGNVHVSFVDWIPAICSVLGMAVVSAIDKAKLTDDHYGGTSALAWKAKLVLFVGFALLAGGLAGGVVVLVLKYIVPGYPMPTLWFGIANVVCNSLIMLASAVLWVSINADDEYQYQLQL
ncbi:Vacuolar protein sorting-associated protein 68 [Savitreella phatthalungensis]